MLTAIESYKAAVSQQQLLQPSSKLVDSRNEQDWLNFLCNFSTLINFYDEHDRKKGNWLPFLLKDSVFLLAHISKTDFNALHHTYINCCSSIERWLIQDAEEGNEIGHLFSLLFGYLTDVFVHLKRWVYFMQLNNDSYDLKNYVVYQTKETFSSYYWAFNSLQQNLHSSRFIPNVIKVDAVKFFFFDAYEETIWKENKNKTPYLEILGLKNPLKSNTHWEIYEAVKYYGDKIFAFFYTVINNANEDFIKQKALPCKYPDTTLLRAFTSLLGIYQDQLNKITEKHLKFYYSDILKQEKLPASPDKVMLVATPGKNYSAFMLPKGTLFNAGLNEKKQPILFETQRNVVLNQAEITGGYTFGTTVNQGPSNFYTSSVPPAGAIQKDINGAIESWAPFGGNSTGTFFEPFFAIASPILYLTDGIRQITVKLFLDGVDQQSQPKLAACSLSSAKGWFTVTPANILFSASESTLQFDINLVPGDPAILPFGKVNPDKLQSDWPIIKLSFQVPQSYIAAINLIAADIGVTVKAFNSFELYTGTNLLKTTNPFLPFGSMPPVNSSFSIGSAEIFSKPLQSFNIILEWDSLPSGAGFNTYYERYNTYLNNPVPPWIKKKPQSAELNWWQRFWRWLKGLFSKQKQDDELLVPFNNTCFKVNFKILEKNSWRNFHMLGNVKLNDHLPEIEETPRCEKAQDQCLFETVSEPASNEPDTLLLKSCFYYTVPPGLPAPSDMPDATIQLSPLKLNSATNAGFIKMTLSEPAPYGFGSSLYPNVVTWVSLTNGYDLVNSITPYMALANVPYTPKLKTFSGEYTASYKYEFTGANENAYPIECFMHTPFENYTVFDSSTDKTDATLSYLIGQSVSSTINNGGIPLLPQFLYDGYWFLQMQNVVSTTTFNLYFELTNSFSSTRGAATVNYYYLSTSGWSPAPLINDGTNNLSCSGIVTIGLPDDITAVVTGNAKNYWLCLTASGQAGSFSNVIYYQANGFSVKRQITEPGLQIQPIVAGTITKPFSQVPQLATINQPFASFGGEEPETRKQMDGRVSLRLKTKDRAVSGSDFEAMIKQQFKNIFYAKAVYNEVDEIIDVFVVPVCYEITNGSSFLPLVSNCDEQSITAYLSEKCGGLNSVKAINFNLEYVLVATTLRLADGYAADEIISQVISALNIFLSPWVTSECDQVIIGQIITASTILPIIKAVPGVASIKSLVFYTWPADISPTLLPDSVTATDEAAPNGKSWLLVPFPNHQILFK